MTDIPQIPQIIEITDRHLDATLDRLQRGLEPQWHAQFELGKMLLALASGALVLSISVTQLLVTQGAHPQWGLLLPLSWVLFAITILAAAVRQSWAGTAQGLRVWIEQRRADVRGKVAALRPGPDFGDRFDAVLAEVFNHAIVKSDRAIKIHNRTTWIMFWSFALGMLALLVFAIRNLRF